MSNEITTQNNNLEEAVKNYIRVNNLNLSPADLELIRHICVARGLNPLNKDVYITFINRAPQLIVAYTKMVEMANRQSNYGGNKIHEPKLVTNPYTKKEDVSIMCEIFNKNGIVIGSGTTFLSEYKQSTGGRGIWDTKPHVMLEKVALTNALRKTFGDMLQGIYIAEEFSKSEKELDTQPILSKVEPLEIPVEPVEKEPSNLQLFGELFSSLNFEEKFRAKRHMKEFLEKNKIGELNMKNSEHVDIYIRLVKEIITERENEEVGNENNA